MILLCLYNTAGTILQWKLDITRSKAGGTGKICSLSMRFCYIGVLFHVYFTTTEVKNIVCYAEDYVIVEVS